MKKKSDPVISLTKWRESVGLSRSAVTTYRRKGLIVVDVNVNGRWFIRQSEADRFAAAALNGEFKRKIKTPHP